MSGWFTGEYSFKCQPVDYSNKPSTIRVSYFAKIKLKLNSSKLYLQMVNASWWYFFSKFTEFADTVSLHIHYN